MLVPVSVISVVSLTCSVVGTVHLLLHYRRTTSAVAWLFALWTLPLAGTLLYAMLAVYEGPSKLRRRRRHGEQLRARTEIGSSRGIASEKLPPAYELPRLGSHISTPFRFAGGHRLEILEDGAAALEAMLDAISKAGHEILFQTYILKSGKAFERLADALTLAAKRDVRVRVLIDPIGTTVLPDEIEDQLAAAGVETVTYTGPNPLKGRFQINFRNHRKVLLVDRSLAFVGGRNWSDHDFGLAEGRRCRDLTVAIHGPAVIGLRRVFAEDFAIASDRGIERIGFDWPNEDIAGGTFARVYPSGPDESEPAFLDVVGAALGRATKSIFIVTPYFAPGTAMLHRLRIAALSGLDVTVLMPQRSDHRFIDYAGRHFAREMAAVGVRVLLRRDQQLHAKTIIVDGCYSVFGSMNFDVRSFVLNYEISVEVLGEEFATRLRAYYDPDIAASTVLDPRARVPIHRRILERFTALFEPIL
jgi:cardiolipin synthase